MAEGTWQIKNGQRTKNKTRNEKMVKIINKYRVIIFIILPILILILFRTYYANNFKSDAKKWAEPSITRSNIISGENFGNLAGRKLIINLSGEYNGINEMGNVLLNVPADSILSKKNLNAIRKHQGPVLLFSSETSVSSRIWMILSQMGIKNIFILTSDSDDETFKNKFSRDTITSPEF
jgi:hypothetical protein